METPDPVRFDDPSLVLPEALRRALAGRGYENTMPVQAAILAPAARGRDLLVSSPTGSGKTIAFGSAMAETLLDGPAPAAAGIDGAPVVAAPAPAPAGFGRASAAAAPRALVVVPTRELAIQVREELGWLLAGTGLRLTSFTGGTAVSGDLRALRRGVDVAIGTPGRLCDLMRRQ
jgi:ATP-dependent RNA helicase DeaD